MEKLQRALELAQREPRTAASERPEPYVSARVEPIPQVRSGRWRRVTAPIGIAEAERRRRRLRVGDGRDAVSEAYRLLRTHVLQRMNRHGFRSLALVSAAPEEGKTLTAINLAFSIAQDARHTALLVDLDLRNPEVHSALGIPVTRGIECYFNHGLSVDELIVTVMNDRMAVLPCLEPVASPSEVLASSETHVLVQELTGRYADRIVLFDLSPMLVGDDVISFLPHVDAALVVVGEGSTRRQDLARMFDLLGNTPVVGTVLNRSREATIKPYR